MGRCGPAALPRDNRHQPQAFSHRLTDYRVARLRSRLSQTFAGRMSESAPEVVRNSVRRRSGVRDEVSAKEQISLQSASGCALTFPLDADTVGLESFARRSSRPNGPEQRPTICRSGGAAAGEDSTRHFYDSRPGLGHGEEMQDVQLACVHHVVGLIHGRCCRIGEFTHTRSEGRWVERTMAEQDDHFARAVRGC